VLGLIQLLLILSMEMVILVLANTPKSVIFAEISNAFHSFYHWKPIRTGGSSSNNQCWSMCKG